MVLDFSSRILLLILLLVVTVLLFSMAEPRSLRSKYSPATQSGLQKSMKGPDSPLTLLDLNSALDTHIGKINSRIDSLLEKRLSSSFEKLRNEIRSDLLEEISQLKTLIEAQAQEIATLKTQVSLNSDMGSDLESLALVSHRLMQNEIASNAVISGLSEDAGDDADKVMNVLTVLDCSDCQIADLERIGAPISNRPRLLKVRFRTRKDKIKVVRNCRRLRNDPKFNGVYINSDLTLAERKERKRLRIAMDRLKADDVTANVRISKGVLYHNETEVDRALPHCHLFRPREFATRKILPPVKTSVAKG